MFYLTERVVWITHKLITVGNGHISTFIAPILMIKNRHETFQAIYGSCIKEICFNEQRCGIEAIKDIISELKLQ